MASDTVKYPDAILRVCSQPQRDLGGPFIVRPCPHEMQTAQEYLQTAFETLPASGMGKLDRLPPELILMVLCHLDIFSYFQFRQVNRRARILSITLREYRLVTKHGLECLRSLLRTGLAHNFTITDLYRLLINPSCKLCGCLGGFLFLLTATRCCFSCILTSPKLRVISRSTLAKITRLSKSELDWLLDSTPGLRPASSSHSLEEGQAIRPKCLFVEEQAIATLKSLGVVHKKFAHILAWRNDHITERFTASTAFPWYNPDNAQVEYGASCKGCQVPYYIPDVSYENRMRVFFSTADFFIHFKNCVKAQNLWARSQQGTIPV
ncbi:hypothetical protein F4815DRAFT_444300 [Daldinia loculata]|nr:hypothetical protein F4815DRAFT_444300 [Daldinia loculata]